MIFGGLRKLKSLSSEAIQSERETPRADGEEPHAEQRGTVNQRLDDLTRRIKQLSTPAPHAGPEAYAPRRSGPNAASPAPAPVTPTPPQLPPSLEKALFEITTRQRVLTSVRGARESSAVPAPAPASTPASADAPVPAPAAAAADPVPPAAVPAPAAAAPVAPAAAAATTTVEPVSPPAVPASAPTSIPIANLVSLEEQLRAITGKIDSLRQHDVERAIAALREELTEIGRSLNEALPRHSLEIIEWRIHDLTKRIADGRLAGADTDALARVEHGLGEVRDTLHGLTPAENLVGFNDAVVDLARRIDLVVAQRDPETFAQLESAITTLRAVANHIASNETVGRLAAEVQALGDKIEQFAQATAGGGTLNNLESSITSLSDALAERSQSATVSPRIEPLLEQLVDKVEQIQDSRHSDNATLANIENRLAMLTEELSAPARDGSNAALANIEHRVTAIGDELAQRSQNDGALATRFEGLLEQLSAKIEQIHLSRDSSRASFSQLEDRINHLVQRLDASDSRLGSFEAVERALSDLVTHVDEIRANSGTLHADRMQSAYDIKADIARTQDAIDGLHATLGVVVDRLAAIEHNAHGQPNPEIDTSLTELRRAIDKLADQSFAAPPAPPPPPAASPPIDPDLPPDQPLEPGSGGPRRGNVAVSVEAPRSRARRTAGAGGHTRQQIQLHCRSPPRRPSRRAGQ